MSAIQASELVGTLWFDDSTRTTLLFSRINGSQFAFIILDYAQTNCTKNLHFHGPMNIDFDFHAFTSERGLLKLGTIADLDIPSYLEENEQVKASMT